MCVCVCGINVMIVTRLSDIIVQYPYSASLPWTMPNEFVVKIRPLDKVEYCFDTVAIFGNYVKRDIFAKFRLFD